MNFNIKYVNTSSFSNCLEGPRPLSEPSCKWHTWVTTCDFMLGILKVVTQGYLQRSFWMLQVFHFHTIFWPNLTETFCKLAFSQRLNCFPEGTIFIQTCFRILHYVELKYISTTEINLSTTKAFYFDGHLMATESRSMCSHGRVSYTPSMRHWQQADCVRVRRKRLWTQKGTKVA